MSTDIQGVSDALMQHYKTEEQILEQILLLEDFFREYYSLMKTELLMQKNKIPRLCVLAQRHIALISDYPTNRHPDIYTGPAQEALLQEFNESLQLLRNSNRRLCLEIIRLRQYCRTFDQLCDQLDMSIESPFILGDTFHKPLAFFIELISDLFKYFHAWVLKIKFNSHLIDPVQIKSIEFYKTLIEPSEDFDEYFNMGLTYCKCLRPKPDC